MQATRKIMEQIINASKISRKPAYISYPVLRSEDNKIYLAAFSIEFRYVPILFGVSLFKD